MKKRKIITFFAFLMIFLVESSCIKKDDFKFEDVNFEISPTMIVPLFDVDITMEKMLGLFEETEGYILYGENDETIVTYTDTNVQSIEITDWLKNGKEFRNDTLPISGDLDIDFFENMDDLDANMTDIYVQLFASSSQEIDVTFKDMRLGAVMRDGSIGYLSLNESFTVSTEDSTEILRENVAQFINGYPTNFFYEGVIEVDSSFYLGLLMGGFQLPDKVDFNLYFNLQAKIKGSVHNVNITNNLEFDIEMQDTVDVENAALEVSILNNFPFDFDLEMRLYDANDNLIYDIFNPNYFLQSSEVDENGFVIEGTATACNKEISITHEDYQKIITAKKAVIVSKINSCLDGTKPIVVTKNNGLEINLGIKATPVYSVDF